MNGLMGGPPLVKFGPGSSVRLSVCSSISSSNGRRRVCCWAPPRMQAISIDSRRRRSPANAGSVVLSADVGGWTQTCSFLRHFSVLCATPDRRPRMSYFQSYFSSVHLYRCLHRVTVTWCSFISMPFDFCRHLMGKNSEKCLPLW